MSDELNKLLQFAPPEEEALQDWNLAEKECLKFPAKMLKKARELKECQETLQKETQRLWEEKEKVTKQIYGFVVRNLIPVVDSCKIGLAGNPLLEASLAKVPALGQPAAEEAVPAMVMTAVVTPESETPAEPEAPAEPAALDVQATCLASILRSVLSLLAGLDIHRVELKGLTYDTVAVDGQQVEDPFEILQTTQEGKTRELPVLEVVDDLWISRRRGYLEVLRKGKVNC